MNNVLWSLLLILFISCASNTVTTNTSTTTGWSDDDTYTVKVIDKNEDDAVKMAKHKILKDIVDVRVRNNSKYTDIVKIRDEFDVPLKNGKILKQQNNPEGLTIYYQIRDKGLKKKFQRQ